uniref:Uncharacterized protein n=1 Tax=Anopheles coluzzii TaxID=1518534 RepID=A0A8W7PJX2_ANOCL
MAVPYGSRHRQFRSLDRIVTLTGLRKPSGNSAATNQGRSTNLQPSIIGPAAASTSKTVDRQQENRKRGGQDTATHVRIDQRTGGVSFRSKANLRNRIPLGQQLDELFLVGMDLFLRQSLSNNDRLRGNA